MIYLKLGGSLITEKDKPRTARFDVIRQLASEIKAARQSNPELSILLGHGSGSFGHHVAHRYQTQKGVYSDAQWTGFIEVWNAARDLHNICLEIFMELELEVISFSPSASAICENGSLQSMATEAIKLTINRNLMPVVHGDVAFDLVLGGTIVSTEEVFNHLVGVMPPDRILIAGIKDGVYAHPTEPDVFLPRITEQDLASLTLSDLEVPDVTGGMASKIRDAFEMKHLHPTAEVRIFSASIPGSLQEALSGASPGTEIIA